jgi:hypothetical protein
MLQLVRLIVYFVILYKNRRIGLPACPLNFLYQLLKGPQMSPQCPHLLALKPSQEFTYVRTYSRWIPESLKRRETYPETVERYLSFMAAEVGDVSHTALP